MRFQRRTGQCGLPELLSHSGTHSRSRGQHTVHIRCRCPVGMHSPTTIIRVQQFFPDQLHLCALLPVKLFHPSMVSARRGTSVSFPYKTGGLDVCIISAFTQFVNRLILLFSEMYFLHDISACAARIFLHSLAKTISSAGALQTYPTHKRPRLICWFRQGAAFCGIWFGV